MWLLAVLKPTYALPTMGIGVGSAMAMGWKGVYNEGSGWGDMVSSRCGLSYTHLLGIHDSPFALFAISTPT